jgi:CubicO group peptidase (beta-lactamase class C family)
MKLRILATMAAFAFTAQAQAQAQASAQAPAAPAPPAAVAPATVPAVPVPPATTPPAASAPAAETSAPAPPLIDAAIIDAALKRLVDEQKLVGVSALVYERGREVYFGAFGHADREAGRPMARDTIVQIFSMTKPVTGVALMRMYERGKFRLEDPLEMHAPEFAAVKVFAGLDANGQPRYEAPKRKITMYDILRHTAGFSDDDVQDATGAAYRELAPRAYTNTLAQFAQKLAQVPLMYHPGTRWYYSDVCDVQAYLVEKFSGVPFDRYLDLHIFKPLGMTTTRYTILPTDADRPRLAAVYERQPDGTLQRQTDEKAFGFNGQSWPMKPGSSGLVSTLDDYMKFARMLAGGGKLGRARVLKPETVRLMATDALPREVTDKHFLPSKGQVGFGIDLAVRIAPPKDASEASGAMGEFFWDGAASTLFWVDPQNDITAVLFTQLRPFDKIQLHKTFRDAVYHNMPEALAD